MNSWEKFPEESPVAFAAFACYLEMGGRRSLTAVGRRLGKSKALMERWSSRHSWVERARAYDRHMASVRQHAREAAEAAEAQKWARRRAQQREEEYQIAQRLSEKGKAILQLPHIRVERVTKREELPDGRTVIKHVTIIHPVRCGYGEVARIFLAASMLWRRSAGMPTSYKELRLFPVAQTNAHAGEAAARELTDEELLTIIRSGASRSGRG